MVGLVGWRAQEYAEVDVGMTDESVYLELKGIIIDWAEGRLDFSSPTIAVEPALKPEEVTAMLRRMVEEWTEKLEDAHPLWGRME